MHFRLNQLSLLFALIFSILACRQEPGAHAEKAAETSTLYAEPHRPQFHFSPPAKWMNDPNGMVYYDGEYHLFYQHYPDSTVWGPMHWGHAVSKDMVRWENLPIALYPDSLGYIFSGSAVVDVNNTAGFKNGEEDPIVAIFTYHDPVGAESGSQTYQTQGIAYSNDRGRTWTKYAGNPVLDNPGIRDFRDPKVSWHEESRQWVMILAVLDRVHFYTSPNLKDWTFAGEFGADWGAHGGVWECPDLFELPVEGTDESRWVFLLSINPGGPNGGSATQYFVGDFDGKKFTLDPSFAADLGGPGSEKAKWVDYGRDNYAGVTWANIPASDGRRLFLGWMSNWNYANVVPTYAWRSAMTIPRELVLRKRGDQYLLLSRPAAELKALREEEYTFPSLRVGASVDLTDKIGFSPTLSELILELEIPAGELSNFGIELSNNLGEAYRIGYDAANHQYYSDRTKAGTNDFSEKFSNGLHTAPRAVEGQTVKMHLYLDVSSAELFADDGATVLTEIFFPTGDFDQIRLFSENGTVQLKSGQAFKLRGIW